MKIITVRDPRQLREHPLNVQVYGDEPSADLIESIRRLGVVEPLLVLPDGTVVSGHRRRKAAIIAGHAGVPCRVADVDPSDAVLVEELLLTTNRHREKTTEQKAREYAHWKAIEAEMAKRRLATSTGGTNPRPVETFPQAGTGKARDKAAGRVGWSGRTAEKAAKVTAAIDAAEAAGDATRADGLRELMNGKGIDAAYKLLAGATRETRPPAAESRQSPPTAPVPPSAETPSAGDGPTGEADGIGAPILKAVQEAFDSIVLKLGRAAGDAERLVASEPVAAAWFDGKKFDEFRRNVRSAQNQVKASRPKAVCGYCRGAKCDQCRHTGVLVTSLADSCPATERA